MATSPSSLDIPESLLRALVEGSPLAIVFVNPDWTVRHWNPAAERLFGWCEAEVRDRPLPFVPDEGWAEHQSLRERLARGEAFCGVEVRRRRKDGGLVDVSLSVTPVLDPEGRLAGMVAFMEDIRERKRVEQELRDSERRYRLLAENVSDVLWVFDARLRLTYVSPSVTRLRGYSVEEVLAQSLEERLTPESCARVRALVASERARRAGAGGPWMLELEMPHKHGGTVWVEVNVSPLRDERARIVGLIGVSRDITQRRRVAQQLTLQGAALEAAANAIVITDRAGRIEWVNPAFTRLTGYSADEARGQTPRLLKSGRHDAAFYESLWRTIVGGDVWHGEVVNRRRDGSLYTERETITPVRDASGAITHFIAIKQDVTAYKEATAELERQRGLVHQNEKLAAMGQLLAGVAHELNNPLSVVIGQAALLQMRAKDGPLGARADKIVQAAERCGRIVKNFLALARQHPPERESVHLNRVVEGAIELLGYLFRVGNIEVSLELQPDLPPLWADPHELQQVAVNLLTNAQDAVRDTPPPRRITIATRVDPTGAWVSMEVTDTGPGIPPEVQPRIFEPFFTTKPPGQGTGLGLSLCLSIVENHGGAIRAENVPGGGARFSVELPVPIARPEAAGAAAALAAPPVPGGAVLVVDDEADVAAVLAEMLSGDGHQVDTVPNGRAAIERLERRRYDLVMSDLRMPELDGPGLYRMLESRFPDMLGRVIFLTGDALGPGVVTFLERAARPTVSKPFAAADVHRITQEVLRMNRTRNGHAAQALDGGRARGEASPSPGR
ncbi:MAG TPA: PAS domain S-box protein [Methylomirabilota bacterium]|nr:PAS domain S-box protein [Methylomirabilota bacterium]